MANTYTQIHIQIVFAVKGRGSLISESWEVLLYKYITGIIQNNGHKLLAINGMSDHIHILIGMRPVQSISDLVKQIKQDSSKWINTNQLSSERFAWQAGFGAFSYTKLDVNRVIRYIRNQKEHHKMTTFSDEYLLLLDEFGINFDPKYVLKGYL